MTDEDIVTETITITYTDGTVEVYNACTTYTNSNGIVKFKGKLSGSDVEKSWEINWSSVKKLSREA